MLTTADAIPDSLSEWMGPQTWPGTEFVLATEAAIGPGTGITIDLVALGVDTSLLSAGDTLLFGIHVLNSVKASVASPCLQRIATASRQ